MRGSDLSPIEIASGLVFGLEARAAVPSPATVGTPREELERVVLTALRRPPCLVSFSGGRDSSAVLAVAAHVARREGLALPIPATHRFASVESSREDGWQEQVVRHIGLDDWLRVEQTDELDCVGPVAADVLRRHGLLWPFNAHFHTPLLRLAAGGSLLTGIGGDEMLSESTWTEYANDLRARRRPGRRDLRRLAFLLAPRAARRRALRSRLPLPYAWLRPDARRHVAESRAAQNAAEPLRWSAHVRWVQRIRYVHVALDSVRRLAGDDDVRLVHPFLDGGVVAAIRRLPRAARFSGRTAAMQSLFGDLLPDAVLGRSTKAFFDAAFWNEPSRAFAAQWDGSGVDLDVVDPDALRAEWSSEAPDPRSFTLAQSVWLATRAGSAEPVAQPRDRVRQ
jgi:asparagine synthetase B (glutamine-hydrolysing)